MHQNYAEQELVVSDEEPIHPDARARFDSIDQRLDAGSKRMKSIEQQLAENTELTRDVREFLETGRAGLRVLGVLGSVASWLGKLATAGLALWALFQAIKHGGPPPGK